MKLCFIGNSHLGPIAAALQGVSNLEPGIEVGHFISRTYGKIPLKVVTQADAEVFPYVKIEDRPDLNSVLFLDDWDAIVVVGFGFSLIRMVEGWAAFQPDSLNGDLGGHYLVPDFSMNYDNDCIDTTQAVRLVHRLREMTAKPIYLVPAPLPAEWASERRGQTFAPFRELREAGDERNAAAAFERQLRRLPGRRIKPIKQPASTIASHMWTRTEFGLGQPEDSAEGSFYARGDFYHMNKKFGETYLREIVSTINADLGVGTSSEETGSY